MSHPRASRPSGLFSPFVFDLRKLATYMKWIGSSLGVMRETPDGGSTMSESSKSDSSVNHVLRQDYVNPWLTCFGKRKPGVDGYVMSGLIPETGTRTELRAALLAVYDPLPQPGELYVVHCEFTDITTGEKWVEDKYLETLSIDYAAELIEFKVNTRTDNSRIIKYSFNSWHSIRSHGNFKFIGSAT